MAQDNLSEIFYTLEALVNENKDVTSFLIETFVPKFVTYNEFDSVKPLLELMYKNQEKIMDFLKDLQVDLKLLK